MIFSYFCRMETLSNSVKELRHRYVEMLCKIYDKEEANALLMILLEHHFGISRVALALNPDMLLSDTECLTLQSSIRQLTASRPIQYVIGKTEFCGLEFEVDENVLIPRPETEELVTIISSQAKTLAGAVDVLDIGTGSGCIAVSLARLIEGCRVTAIDISGNALDVARRNAARNGASVNFINADILSDPALPRRFDIIVSNPPYVCESERRDMRANVLDFEPPTALFVSDDDPLVFYRHIIDFARTHLKPHGTVWFEVNEHLGAETAELCRRHGFGDSAVMKDLFGKDRYVKAAR